MDETTSKKKDVYPITKLWMPVIKNPNNGSYLAVLSDTSLDRDEEAMSKELIYSWASNNSVKALVNHDNKMQSWVGGWRNLKACEKNGHYALFAEPWFFSEKANPLAAQVQKMVDEALEHGECAGISVGAIIHDSEIRKINNKDVRVFTKGELIEATWVPVQSNRNASFGHVAKDFDTSEIFKQEEIKVEKEFTQKDLDSAVEKKVEEMKLELSKQLELKMAELEEVQKVNSELNIEKAKIAEKVAELEASLEKEKKLGLEKQKFANQNAEEVSSENVEKSLQEGKLPVMRFM